jgi:hypothetical protein
VIAIKYAIDACAIFDAGISATIDNVELKDPLWVEEVNLLRSRNDSNDRQESGRVSPVKSVNERGVRERRLSGRSGAVNLARTPRNRPCQSGQKETVASEDSRRSHRRIERSGYQSCLFPPASMNRFPATRS